MNTRILLREYKKQDNESLIDIIREAWHYDEFCSPGTAGKLAKIFLYSCLTNQTYTQVAEVDGKAVGVIMAKNIRKHRCPVKYRIGQLLCILSLLLSREGRKTARIFQNVSAIDRRLLEQSKKEYQGEVAFFAVSSEYRGLKIGKTLFDQMLHYMKSQGITDFYLFTDTSCNYGFYNHQGMSCADEETEIFTVNQQKEKMTFFIYEYALI